MDPLRCVFSKAAHSRNAKDFEASANRISPAAYDESLRKRAKSIQWPWPAISHLKSTSASNETHASVLVTASVNIGARPVLRGQKPENRRCRLWQHKRHPWVPFDTHCPEAIRS